ncbi:kelch-like protein 17 [Cucumis melo var. makuwa]|uniref:Kelch-like protein 17 n=1 Tax=Cucumis melo var. makuwa TaxID=1194695 RepID=A0A5D3BY57_CUCMM|nr:kelch-like protein 17 [Cucumis melo var. makuwa]
MLKKRRPLMILALVSISTKMVFFMRTTFDSYSVSSAKEQEAVETALKAQLVILNTAVAGKWLDVVLKENVPHVLPKRLISGPCPPFLNLAKGSLRGVSIGNKLFAIGGGNGIESLTDVEMLTLDIGRWICTRSMLQRRFVAGAVELNGILYASEGFDGSDYLKQWQIFLFISTLVPT